MSFVAEAIAQLSFAVVVGSLVWFFFVQTMFLMRRLGRDRFVPLQLVLVRPLFKTVLVLSLIGAVASWIAHASFMVLSLAGAAVFLAGALVGLVVPRAVRAGGASLREAVSAADQTSLGRFTVDGGGDATKVWHRVLGLMAVALVFVGGAQLVVALPRSQASHNAMHAHVSEKQDARVMAHRWPANRETVEGVREMQALVAKLQSEQPLTRAPALELRAAWKRIFERCTMKGEAHEALHSFLMPIGATLDELEQVSDRDAANAVVTRMASQLATFERDFMESQ